MWIVAGLFEVEEGRREQLLEERKAAMVTSRSETGCLQYCFSADPIDPTKMLLFEMWENSEALEAHLARNRASTTRPSNEGIVHREIKRYEVSGALPL